MAGFEDAARKALDMPTPEEHVRNWLSTNNLPSLEDTSNQIVLLQEAAKRVAQSLFSRIARDSFKCLAEWRQLHLPNEFADHFLTNRDGLESFKYICDNVAKDDPFAEWLASRGADQMFSAANETAAGSVEDLYARIRTAELFERTLDKAEKDDMETLAGWIIDCTEQYSARFAAASSKRGEMSWPSESSKSPWTLGGTELQSGGLLFEKDDLEDDLQEMPVLEYADAA